MTIAIAAGAQATAGVGASAGTGVSPSVAALTPAQRAAANQSIGNQIDQNLPAQLSSLLAGSNLSVTEIASLSGSIKASVRASLSKSFGVAGPTGTGGGTSATGGLSLASSIGFKAGGSAKLGVTPTGALNGKAGLKFSVGAQLKASLGTFIAAGLIGAGVQPTQRRAIQSELEPTLGSSLDNSLGSAFGPDPGYPHASGALIVGAEITMQTQGPWFADVEVDIPEDGTVPDGPFRFSIENVEFVGTVKPSRSGQYGGRTRLRVIGGAGGLDAPLSARNYAGGVTRHRTVVADILRDSGEVLSSESDSALLDVQIAGWHRSECTGRQALDQITAKAGCTWRVLRDGTVWVGNDGWPELSIDDKIIDVHHGDGLVLSAPDAPDAVPGQVVMGHRILQVVHRVDHRGLRTEHHARSVRSVRDKILEPAMTAIDYSRAYPCKVENQNDDGTLQVVPEDDVIKATGLDHCDVYVGLPGTTVKVPSGAECLVRFKAGDPSRAYVESWKMGTPFTSIDFG